MKRAKQLLAVSMVVLALLALSAGVTTADAPLGTAFTYQGRLTDGGNAANGTYDFEFRLFDAVSGGAQIGATLTKDNVSVASGLFVVTLDFGASAFGGRARFLQIGVRPGSSTGAFTALTPRQALNPTPYALFAGAPWLTNGNTIYYSKGNVGIGTSAPTSKLEIVAQNGLAITGYQPYLTLRDTNGGNQRGIIQSVNGDLVLIPNSFIGTGAAMVLRTTTGKIGVGTATPSDRLTVATAVDNYGLVHTDGVAALGTYVGKGSTGTEGGWFGTKTNHPLRFFVNDTGVALSIDTTNNVGIGTIAPSALLSVVKSGAPQPTVGGLPTALKVGAPSGTVPLAVKQNAAENLSPLLATFETSNGNIGHLRASSSIFVIGATAGKALGFNVNDTTRAITIGSDGNVGVGTNNIYAKMHVQSAGTTSGTRGFMVTNGNGDVTFQVQDDGVVSVAALYQDPYGTHVCLNPYSPRKLSRCGSAAEYVPTVDDGSGFPETADLVSVAPQLANPYEDEHGPFVVTKSGHACDENLLGYIVEPDFGADGVKKNDHYLPLAIYGYFPAKVTLENGIIRRGDPLTSSSKPGYAMKATNACKIIGYALDDANTEGTVQVFAKTGENSAPEVATLRAQITELKQQNAALEQRLARLEQWMSTQSDPTTALNWKDK